MTHQLNKPVAFICACVAAVGLLILGRSAFLTIAYGHGAMEAGNFNRCWYSSTQDPQTGKIVREWDVLGESTEDTFVERLDMWFVGTAFVIVGAGIFVVERSSRSRGDEF